MALLEIEGSEKNLLRVLAEVARIEAEEEKVMFKVSGGDFDKDSSGLNPDDYVCRFDHDTCWNDQAFEYLGRVELIEKGVKYWYDSSEIVSKREADMYQLIDSNPAHYTLFLSDGFKYEGDIEAIENYSYSELYEQIKSFIEEHTNAEQ